LNFEKKQRRENGAFFFCQLSWGHLSTYVWEYLLKVYHQDNTARRFQLEYEIANYTQGNLSIQEYFSGFQNLWGEFSDMVYAKVSAASLSDV
jgi:hypothetical protein